ncbi:PadR family transcriptional regulator [Tessaracoccus antarcticus]|uniref:PadR family transcriptional regulator n=1 Tax=Tessaracoccus antarcticus TaxID=2479848 RepID=A0A3M0G5G9_9ACTN|nr:PadR family transcriptional regulator [Tessaracoccus antarcticus]
MHHTPDGPGPHEPDDASEFGRGRGRGRGPGGRGPGGRHDGQRDAFGDAFEGAFDGISREGMHRGPGHGRGFGPRGPRRAGRGDVRLAILSLLADAPSNGYGLISAVAERTGNAWRPSSGSVYPTLQQLVDEELIVSSGEGRGTAYELTEAGRTYVQENEAAITQAWAATPGRNESEVAFHESVTKLKGVIQQFRLAATDAQRTAATQTLDEARRALYLILAD